MPLTTEQLLQPRYRVIADYPFSPYKVDDIILEHAGQFPVLNIPGHDLLGLIKITQINLPFTEAERFPHHNEFPEYVVFSPKFRPQEVRKVERMNLDEHAHVKGVLCEGENSYYPAYIYDRPATKEEYEQYKRK
jgi:hypothetical protein